METIRHKLNYTCVVPLFPRELRAVEAFNNIQRIFNGYLRDSPSTLSQGNGACTPKHCTTQHTTDHDVSGVETASRIQEPKLPSRDCHAPISVKAMREREQQISPCVRPGIEDAEENHLPSRRVVDVDYVDYVDYID